MEHKKFTWKHYTLIAVGIVFVIYCCIAVYFSKKFTYGTKINGVDVSNKIEEHRHFQKKGGRLFADRQRTKRQRGSFKEQCAQGFL